LSAFFRLKKIDFIFATFFKGLGLKKAAAVLPRLLFFDKAIRIKTKSSFRYFMPLKV
jgi:hypothetical protein